MQIEHAGATAIRRKQLDIELAHLQQTDADALKVSNKKLELELTKVDAELTSLKLQTELLNHTQSVQVTSDKNNETQRIAEAELVRQRARIEAETTAAKERLAAVTPELAKALNAAGDNVALIQLAEKLGIAAYLKQDSLGATINTLVQGTDLAGAVARLRGA